MSGKTKKPININEDSILEQLLRELDQKVNSDGGNCNITKGEALIKSMVDEAIMGDQRMMANVLKFIDKIDELKSAKKNIAKKKK